MGFIFNPFSGNIDYKGKSGSATPGGSNTQVQFNDSGAFGGDSGFTYNKSTDQAAVGSVLLSNLSVNGGGMNRTNNSGTIALFGGQDYQDGAYFNLTGKTYGSSPGKGSGEFVIGQDSTSGLESVFQVFSTNFAGGFTRRFVVRGDTGNVGVGIDSPQQKLEVNGNAGVTDGFSKRYAFRTDGTNLDITGYGKDIYVATFPNFDGTGTQRTYLQFGAEFTFAKAYNKWIWDGGAGDYFTIEAAGSGTYINANGTDKPTRIGGDTDTNLIYVNSGTDKVGIGTSTPASKLTTNGDVEVLGSANGLILASPNGTRWRITVSNAGALTATSI